MKAAIIWEVNVQIVITFNHIILGSLKIFVRLHRSLSADNMPLNWYENVE